MKKYKFQLFNKETNIKEFEFDITEDLICIDILFDELGYLEPLEDLLDGKYYNTYINTKYNKIVDKKQITIDTIFDIRDFIIKDFDIILDEL